MTYSVSDKTYKELKVIILNLGYDKNQTRAEIADLYDTAGSDFRVVKEGGEVEKLIYSCAKKGSSWFKFKSKTYTVRQWFVIELSLYNYANREQIKDNLLKIEKLNFFKK